MIPALLVKKLDPSAILPTVNHPGEDLAYDLYALEDALLNIGMVTKVKTGVALRFETFNTQKFGLLLRDRSSLGSKGLAVLGGVVDYGYTGEAVVMLLNNAEVPYEVKAGDKIAQAIPIPIVTNYPVVEVEELGPSARGSSGFGSSGR